MWSTEHCCENWWWKINAGRESWNMWERNESLGWDLTEEKKNGYQMKKVISNKRKMTIRMEDDSMLFLVEFIKSRVQHKWASCDLRFPVHIHAQVGSVDY